MWQEFLNVSQFIAVVVPSICAVFSSSGVFLRGVLLRRDLLFVPPFSFQNQCLWPEMTCHGLVVTRQKKKCAIHQNDGDWTVPLFGVSLVPPPRCLLSPLPAFPAVMKTQGHGPTLELLAVVSLGKLVSKIPVYINKSVRTAECLSVLKCRCVLKPKSLNESASGCSWE